MEKIYAFFMLNYPQHCERSRSRVKLNATAQIMAEGGKPKMKPMRRSQSQPMNSKRRTAADPNSNSNPADADEPDLLEEAHLEKDLEACEALMRTGADLPAYGNYRFAIASADYRTSKPLELSLTKGDSVRLIAYNSNECMWFGAVDTATGWFPANCVQVIDQNDSNSNGQESAELLRKMEQTRAHVIREIITTERDYVHLLENLIEGFLKQARRRTDMFTEEQTAGIFGNLEELYWLHRQFVGELESCIEWEDLQASIIGNCFLKFEHSFEIYANYCNNRPQSSNELMRLYADNRYKQFFEACRLLRDMTELTLDGFLLTPVQRICKYPLQLNELLKSTPKSHPDRSLIESAFQGMKRVAQNVNERKQRLESLQILVAWQNTIEQWRGPDLLETSHCLIYHGVVWCRSFQSRNLGLKEVTMFLFDHLLVVCKKDILKKTQLICKDRLCTDFMEIIEFSDGKDHDFGISVKHAWALRMKVEPYQCYLVSAKTKKCKSDWMEAFAKERDIARDSLGRAFTAEEKRMAQAVVLTNRSRQSNPSQDDALQRIPDLIKTQMNSNHHQESGHTQLVLQSKDNSDHNTKNQKYKKWLFTSMKRAKV